LADGIFGDKVKGFDRDFLRALVAGAAAGKVLLGEQLRGDHPLLPTPGQRIAVRQQQNIRPLNVFLDSDDVVRRVPLTFTIDGKPDAIDGARTRLPRAQCPDRNSPPTAR